MKLWIIVPGGVQTSTIFHELFAFCVGVGSSHLSPTLNREGEASKSEDHVTLVGSLCIGGGGKSKGDLVSTQLGL